MENASKALLIAGGVLLTILVISVLVYAWGLFSDYQTNQDKLVEMETTAQFNQQFTNYERDDVTGYDVLSLVNKVIDYNQRISSAGANTDSAAGNESHYPPIKVIITLYGTNGLTEDKVAQKFTTFVTPTPPDTYTGVNFNTLQLFTSDHYETSDTNNFFGKKNINGILKEVSDIEKEKQFGGSTGLQNLVKNIDTIYESKIYGYSQDESDNLLPGEECQYDVNYILAKYKTLTGYSFVKAGDRELDLPDRVEEMRSNGNLSMVLKYYEYSYFKKGKFKCTRIEYDDGVGGTGRVTSMSFDFTGDLM